MTDAVISTRRERIAAILADHPEGLPTPRIVELLDDDGTNQRSVRCWEALRVMEKRAEVARCPSLSRATWWRLVPEHERERTRALYNCARAADALTPDDWAFIGTTREAFDKWLAGKRKETSQ